MFEVRCKCGKATKVRPSLAGETIQCGHCGDRLGVPSLSTLRACSERGEAAPSRQLDTEPERPRSNASRIPDNAFVHVHGVVGSKGRVSASAMENYVALVTRAIEQFAEAVPQTRALECMIGCVLTPRHRTWVCIETVPSQAERETLDQLAHKIESIPAPPVTEGPVAFAVYRRVHCPASSVTSLKPFGPLLSKMEKLGADRVLEDAAAAQHGDRPHFPLRSMLRRLAASIRSKLRRDSQEGTLDAEAEYDRWNRWLETVEDNFDLTVAHQFKSEEDRVFQNLGRLVWLAAACGDKQDWDGAIQRYTSALKLFPHCAPLLARRARVYRLSGNRQSSLADWNEAIARAPHDPWLFYHRSEIYADLEAWSKAEEDLNHAARLAPIEPTFLLARSGIRYNQDNTRGAMEDLKQVVSLDPNSGQALMRLGWLLQGGGTRDLSVAVEYLTRSIELMPDQVEPLFQRALAYASQNKFELALQDCDAIIRRQPEHAPAHGIRGRVLQVQGEFDAAIESCTKAIDLGWDAPIAFLARGFAYAATDQLDLALLDCDAVDAMEPNNPLCCQLRGLLSFQRGELETAMDAFAKARDLAPDWPEPREQLAMLHRINEDPQAAVEEQNVLVNQQPDCAAHYVNRAFAYAQLADYDNAVKDYDHAVDLEPENEQIRYLRGCYLLDRGELESALEDFDRTIDLAGEHDDARARRAAILLQLKRPHEALEEYEKLIAKHPDDPQAYSGHAFANQLIGNDQAAEQDFDQVRRLAPDESLATTVRSLFGKARALEQRERYEEAIEIASEIVQLVPEETVGYEIRAWLQWCDEQYVEALDDFTHLLSLAEDHPNALNGRGHVQAEMGDWRLALDDLDRAVELGRKKGQIQLLAYALNGRALALAGLGRVEESARDYDESISLCPQNAWVHYNRGIMLLRQGDQDQARRLLRRAIDCDDPPLPKRKRERAMNCLAQS